MNEHMLGPTKKAVYGRKRKPFGMALQFIRWKVI
jgi:hypothetical protein